MCVCVCVCVERGGHFKFCTLRRYLGNKLMAEFIWKFGNLENLCHATGECQMLLVLNYIVYYCLSHDVVT